ncbi:RNA polymerase sigma factor [Halobacillus sp. B29]|uniref:RNA polymerase sigma factor n=1 Tax=Halobacillus sp. B29 TaxID=3457432 RepID=UPI003FCE65F1
MDDSKLVKEILSGSEAAAEVLTRKYYKMIYAFVYRKMQNKDLAYDLTQDIFIKMMNSLHTYSSKGNFKSWLFTIAVNRCRDYWKSSYHRYMRTHSELPQSLTDQQQNVSYIFDKKETREEIKKAVEMLPDYQKEALLLKYFHDMKIKEIGEVTSVKEATVKSRLKQGLKKLKSILKRGEENGEKNFQNHS